jgi:hypothetical protein
MNVHMCRQWVYGHQPCKYCMPLAFLHICTVPHRLVLGRLSQIDNFRPKDMIDNSDWSGSHMFDPECWADNELEGWPQRVESGIYASYDRLMPFASKSIRTTMTPDLGISFVTFSSVGQEE